MQGAPGRMRQLEVLPQSLDEALDALSNDDVILSALGPYVSDRYIAAKRQEFAEYNRQVDRMGSHALSEPLLTITSWMRATALRESANGIAMVTLQFDAPSATA